MPKVSSETLFTVPKQSIEEPPIQDIPDDSPCQPKIPQNLNKKCEVEMNTSQQDTLSHAEAEDPITHQQAYSETALVPYK